MLHDVLQLFGQVHATTLHQGMHTSSVCNTQHATKKQPNAHNMLHPIMLRYVVLKCCDRLAGLANTEATNANTDHCIEMLSSFGWDF